MEVGDDCVARATLLNMEPERNDTVRERVCRRVADP